MAKIGNCYCQYHYTVDIPIPLLCHSLIHSISHSFILSLPALPSLNVKILSILSSLSQSLLLLIVSRTLPFPPLLFHLAFCPLVVVVIGCMQSSWLKRGGLRLGD